MTLPVTDRRPTRSFTRALVLIVIAPWAALTAAAGGQLIWADEFDGASLDQSNWEYMLGDGCQYGICGWGNNELQWYTSRPENIFVSDGMLHIVARQDNWRGHEYTSARIRSQNRADFQYGRMEARLRLPQGEGIWPAFWMLPTNSPYGGWARSGEIDIMESIDVPLETHGTLIYGDRYPDQVYNTASYSDGGVNFANDFHVYALEWEPDVMRWYVDGVLYHTVTGSTWWSAAAPGNPRAPFDTPFHFLLNVAVGGDWPGSPDASTQFPQELTVDYVRVYALCPTCPFHGVPLTVPGRIEAEDYDRGGEGVAYHDVDAGNNGGEYRSDGVDIQAASHGGYNIGWIQPGEWLEYTVDVRTSGYYDIIATVASDTAGGLFQLSLNGDPLGEQYTAPSTGGWQNWVSVEQRVFIPAAGEHRLRFENSLASAGYNLSYFEFFLAADNNRDEHVDFSDALPLLYCMTGPDAPPSNPACEGQAIEDGDIDRDGDLDIHDAVRFQAAYGS